MRVSSTGATRRSGATWSWSKPYSLSRWEFAAREGDVVHFKRNTGLRFKRAAGPSIAMVHPRVILDGRNGYITALISNIRVKTFTFERSVDANGDGQADAGVFALALKSTTFDATTRTSTIALGGGLIVRANGQDVAVLDDPEIVIGATSGGLFALVNGVRVKVGDIDPNFLNVNVRDGTVTVSDRDVRVGALGLALPGLGVLPAGAQLLQLDLSPPQR